MDKLQYKIRPGEEGDLAFVFNSFLKSYKTYNPLAKIAENSPYYSTYHKRMEKHLEDGRLYVACIPEDPEAILGWIAFTQESIIYIYVKSIYRSLGIASRFIRFFTGDELKTPGYVYYTLPGQKLMKSVSKDRDLDFIYKP